MSRGKSTVGGDGVMSALLRAVADEAVSAWRAFFAPARAAAKAVWAAAKVEAGREDGPIDPRGVATSKPKF